MGHALVNIQLHSLDGLLDVSMHKRNMSGLVTFGVNVPK